MVGPSSKRSKQSPISRIAATRQLAFPLTGGVALESLEGLINTPKGYNSDCATAFDSLRSERKKLNQLFEALSRSFAVLTNPTPAFTPKELQREIPKWGESALKLAHLVEGYFDSLYGDKNLRRLKPPGASPSIFDFSEGWLQSLNEDPASSERTSKNSSLAAEFSRAELATLKQTIATIQNESDSYDLSRRFDLCHLVATTTPTIFFGKTTFLEKHLPVFASRGAFRDLLVTIQSGLSSIVDHVDPGKLALSGGTWFGHRGDAAQLKKQFEQVCRTDGRVTVSKDRITIELSKIPPSLFQDGEVKSILIRMKCLMTQFSLTSTIKPRLKISEPEGKISVDIPLSSAVASASTGTDFTANVGDRAVHRETRSLLGLPAPEVFFGDKMIVPCGLNDHRIDLITNEAVFFDPMGRRRVQSVIDNVRTLYHEHPNSPERVELLPLGKGSSKLQIEDVAQGNFGVRSVIGEDDNWISVCEVIRDGGKYLEPRLVLDGSLLELFPIALSDSKLSAVLKRFAQVVSGFSVSTLSENYAGGNDSGHCHEWLAETLKVTSKTTLALKSAAHDRGANNLEQMTAVVTPCVADKANRQQFYVQFYGEDGSELRRLLHSGKAKELTPVDNFDRMVWHQAFTKTFRLLEPMIKRDLEDPSVVQARFKKNGLQFSGRFCADLVGEISDGDPQRFVCKIFLDPNWTISCKPDGKTYLIQHPADRLN